MWALYRRKIEKMDEPVTAARTHMAPVRPLGGSVNIKSMDLLVPFWPPDLCLCGSSRPSPKDSNRNEAIKFCLGDDTMIRSRTRLSIRPPRPFQPPCPPPPVPAHDPTIYLSILTLDQRPLRTVLPGASCLGPGASYRNFVTCVCSHFWPKRHLATFTRWSSSYEFFFCFFFVFF